jgi:hypothetical protein
MTVPEVHIDRCAVMTPSAAIRSSPACPTTSAKKTAGANALTPFAPNPAWSPCSTPWSAS